jgi:hypothetical protein
MNDRTVTVFGGTGFLGRRVVRHLRKHGFSVQIASRHPDRGHRLFGLDPQIRQVNMNGSAIRRLNGAGNLRRSDSIRNRLQPRPKVPNYGGPKVGITGAVRSNFVLKARLPGTEFLDAETERQNRH